MYKNAISADYVKSVGVWNSTYEARSNFIKFAKTASMFEIKTRKLNPFRESMFIKLQENRSFAGLT